MRQGYTVSVSQKVGIAELFAIIFIALILLFPQLKKNHGLLLGAIIIGHLFYLWACCVYAEGKGYSRFLGILGLFYVVGIIILVLLKDKYKNEDATSNQARILFFLGLPLLFLLAIPSTILLVAGYFLIPRYIELYQLWQENKAASVELDAARSRLSEALQRLEK